MLEEEGKKREGRREEEGEGGEGGEKEGERGREEEGGKGREGGRRYTSTEYIIVHVHIWYMQ